MGTQNAQGQFLNPNPYGYYDPYARTGSAYVQTTAVPSGTGKGKQCVLEESASFWFLVELCAWLGIMLFQGGLEELGYVCFFSFLLLLDCFSGYDVSAVIAIEAMILVRVGY